MKKLKILTLLLLTVTLSACGKKEVTVPETVPTVENEVPESTVYKEGMKMEINDLIYYSDMEKSAIFLDNTYKEKKENTIVSPLSLNFALGMVAEGASNDTKELLNLYLNSDDYGIYVEDYMKHTEDLNKEFESFNGKYKNVFEIANSVWVADAKINPEYKKKVTDSYKAQIDKIDASDSVGSAEKINSWINEKTHKMIPSLITPLMIRPDTKSILVNTVYFESAWNEPWNYYEDYKKNFTDVDGNATEIAYMASEGYDYYESETATAFSYPYKNNLSFIGILPKKEGDFNTTDLKIEELLKNKVDSVKVFVEMPRLDFETEANTIKKMMSEIGMEKIFTDEAEFDKILENKMLHIDDIIQKCKIELDENGTKASAATAIMMLDNAVMMDDSEIKEIVLNRPFAFLIYDSEMNQVVFIGKVVRV